MNNQGLVSRVKLLLVVSVLEHHLVPVHQHPQHRPQVVGTVFGRVFLQETLEELQMEQALWYDADDIGGAAVLRHVLNDVDLLLELFIGLLQLRKHVGHVIATRLS